MCGAERAQVDGLLNESSSCAAEFYYSQGLDEVSQWWRPGLWATGTGTAEMPADMQMSGNLCGRHTNDCPSGCFVSPTLLLPYPPASVKETLHWAWLSLLWSEWHEGCKECVLLLQKTGVGLLSPTQGSLQLPGTPTPGDPGPPLASVGSCSHNCMYSHSETQVIYT